MTIPWQFEAIAALTAGGVVICGWLARPKPKPSDYALREARERVRKAHARWKGLKAAKQESESAWLAFRNANTELMRLEGMTSKARGWRGSR